MFDKIFNRILKDVNLFKDFDNKNLNKFVELQTRLDYMEKLLEIKKENIAIIEKEIPIVREELERALKK